MNKYQESLNWLCDTCNYHHMDSGMHCPWTDACGRIRNIQELVDKAMPKKPKLKPEELCYVDFENEEVETEIVNLYYCPVCDRKIGEDDCPFGDYCPSCGQRIDWGELNE